MKRKYVIKYGGGHFQLNVTKCLKLTLLTVLIAHVDYLWKSKEWKSKEWKSKRLLPSKREHKQVSSAHFLSPTKARHTRGTSLR